MVAIALIVFGCFAVAFLSALKEPGNKAAAIGGGSVLLALLGLQVKLCTHALRRTPAPRLQLLLALQSILTYAPLPLTGEHWFGPPGFLAGSLLLTLRGRSAWVLAGCATVADPLLLLFLFGNARIALHGLASTALTGVVLYSVARLASLVGELHAMRTELAQLAVTKERLRFARDLHDLVGYTLSMASVQAELSRRFLHQDPDAASAEIAQLITTLRKTHQEVRQVARGYRCLSLESELESARMTLESAGIKAHLSFHGVEFPQYASSALAAALREGVTNVLRHSDARSCTIRLSQYKNATRLIIVNDRPHLGRPSHEEHDGSGLQNLSERVAALGGVLLTARRGTGQKEEFRLEARLPGDVSTAGNTAEARWTAGRLTPWPASNPSLAECDPDGVDAVSGT
ncbi:sensor histidine kinase [Streptomyces sp. NPDC001339]|uniref:sensor histidine kinase n=1 Tax=Streptomyces sp. NPDC001339 TaxID=3364563 RepID=UPI0036C45697